MTAPAIADGGPISMGENKWRVAVPPDEHQVAWRKEHASSEPLLKPTYTRHNPPDVGIQASYAEATGFIPDMDVTESSLDVLDSSSDDDAYPVMAMLDMWDEMTTGVREQTRSALQSMADETGHIPGNPIIAVLNNAKRKKYCDTDHSGKSRSERRRLRNIDLALGKNIMTKARKWCRAVSKAKEAATDASLGGQPKESPDRSSFVSNFSLNEATAIPRDNSRMRTVQEGINTLANQPRVRRWAAGGPTTHVPCDCYY